MRNRLNDSVLVLITLTRNDTGQGQRNDELITDRFENLRGILIVRRK